MVLGSLLKLASNPTDRRELCRLIQAADTIIGDAQFLQDKDLEQNAITVIKSFKDTVDIRKKIDEFHIAYEQFGMLVDKNGAKKIQKNHKIWTGICKQLSHSVALKL